MAIPFTQKRLLTVEEYHKMAETGILSEDERVELIRGEIIQMSPIGSAHSGKVNRVLRVFQHFLGEDIIVSPQNPVHLGNYSEPEPDLAILHFREDFYENSHPTVSEIHVSR